MIGYHEKLARVLDAMGGLYLLDDILDRINDGRMQSHVVANSWAITQVEDYPRARKLHVVALIGDRADFEALHDKVMSYADGVNAGLVSAYGRKGWMPWAQSHGWRLKAKGWLYHKDM